VPVTLNVPSDDDLVVIDDSQLDALALMLRHPSRYFQRIVESVTFISGGAQQWRRSVQVRLPPVPSTHDGTTAPQRHALAAQRFVVSLGMVQRRRLPDFEVRNCFGHKLNLLTRRQHGHCLTLGMLYQFLLDDEWDTASEAPDGSDVARALDELYRNLFSMLTSVVAARDPSTETIALALTALLEALDASAERIADASRLLSHAYEQMATQTQYLCWVIGRPGETVQLESRYTLSDAPSAKGPSRSASQRSPVALGGHRAGWLGAQWWKWRDWRSQAYAKLGLVPLYYYLPAPSHDHAGSYYLMFAPPADVGVSLMDWGNGRCFDRSSNGIDSAHHTCHIHNGETVKDRSSIFGSAISVFVRATPRDNGKLAAVAFLSLCMAWLAQKGGFLQTPPTQWLLLAPAAIVVFINLQREHHYGAIMRPLRVVMWGYVGLLVLFALSVSFDPFSTFTWLGPQSELNDVVSGALAFASVALLFLFAASSSRYDRIVERLFNRMFERSRIFPGVWSRARKWQRHGWHSPDEAERKRRLDISPDDGTRSYDTANMYAYVARQYVDRRLTEAVVLLAGLAVAGSVVGGGWGSGREAKAARGATPTTTSCVQRAGTTCGPASSTRPPAPVALSSPLVVAIK